MSAKAVIQLIIQFGWKVGRIYMRVLIITIKQCKANGMPTAQHNYEVIKWEDIAFLFKKLNQY